MGELVNQHVIDPEICIRCHACEAACEVGAIEHDDVNVVVRAEDCNHCMSCIPVCPTGSIDNWRWVETPFTLQQQYGWAELPPAAAPPAAAPEATDETVAALLAEAHGGAFRAPASASKPTVNLYSVKQPVEALVQGNYRLTAETSDADVRHIVLSFEGRPFPVLEGQSLGVLAPGLDKAGRAHALRLYSVASPRDGERAGFHNVALTVKRSGVCSNYLCDLRKGDRVKIAGPFGATFLMPDDASARLLMICTGTGAAPFRGFTMRRQRVGGAGDMTLVFGARAPDALPYFGPLGKIPDAVLRKHLVFSRLPGAKKEYVQDRLLAEAEAVADLLADARAHIYVCGLRGMEAGVEQAFVGIAESVGLSWEALRETMRAEGRYHVETY